MNLGRDVKDKKKGLYKYIHNKRKTKENMDPKLNVSGDLVTQDLEKT